MSRKRTKTDKYGFNKKQREKIDAYWEANKDVIEEAGYNKDTFMANVKVLLKERRIRISGALKAFSHKSEFVSQLQVGAENIIKSMKEFKYTGGESLYSDFRRQVQGWKNALDFNNFEYVDGKYIYNGALARVQFVLKTGPHGSQYWDWEEVID